MALPTYSGVAALYGLDICPACTTYSRIGHREGFIDGDGTIHWDVVRPSRAALYRFMLAIGRRHAFHPDDSGVLTSWQLIYRANTWVYEHALRDWHIRFPRRFTADDRAKVRYYLGVERPLLAAPSREEQRAAARWAEERRS